MNKKETVIRSRAVIIDNDELLIVRHLKASKFYALPGGHLEWSEDPKECMEREVIEELGVQPDIGSLLYVYSFVDSRERLSLEFFFEIKNASAYRSLEGVHRSHQHEIEELRWVNKEEDCKVLPSFLLDDFKSGNLPSNNTRIVRTED
jgi:ADP-ribose pyrophosphatase YjhB (NUDIX family)